MQLLFSRYSVLLAWLLLLCSWSWSEAPGSLTLGSSEVVILDLKNTRSLPERPTDSHLYRLPVAVAFSPYGSSADTWLAPGRFDYTELDQTLAALVNLDARAQVLLRVDVDSPPWWEAQNRDALMPSPAASSAAKKERKLTHASWYSPLWRQAARQALQSLVRHVETGRWAQHVFGYELNSGRDGRWVPWHQAPEFQETSTSAQAAFRAWLQRKYGSLAALRVAWGQPRQPLADAPEVKMGHILTQWTQIQIPAAKYMLDSKSPSLYDPSGQQNLADYQQFLGEYTAEVILDLVKAGREAGGAGKRWGACYGHLLWWPEGDWPPSLAGHLGLSRLLTAEEINFLVGPPGAPLAPTSTVESFALRGKDYFEQIAVNVDSKNGLPASTQFLVSRTQAADEERRELRSEHGTPGSGRWALVLDELSLTHLSPAGDLQRVTLQTQAAELAALSHPEVWLAGDLPAARADHAGYVLAATYYVSPTLRETVVRRTQPGTVIIWLYGAGTLEGGFIDPSNIFRLTGLKTTMLNSAGSLRVAIPAGDPLLTPDTARPLLWGPLQPVQPRFVLIAGEETVGSLAGTSWPGLGLRWVQGALVVYSPAPGLPTEVLRRLASQARERATGA